MSRKAAAAPRTEEQQADLAYLVQPAKDLVANFSIDVLTALSAYLEAIQKESEENSDSPPQQQSNGNGVEEVYKLFNFQRACRVISGSCSVVAKKVDHVYDLTLSVVDLIENNKGADGDGATAGGARGRGRGRRVVNLGSTNYDLLELKDMVSDALANYEKAVKEEKLVVDSLRIVDNAEQSEHMYERKHCLVSKPTQFMFKLNHGQFNRTDEQIWNSRPRPDVIGKVKDFDVKKADVQHSQQVLYSHDCYKKNIDEFTLPGARWIPDNKELATNFGVPDVEIELDQEQEKEQVNAYGPFKDPLSGREVVAPPRWFIEKEATRQQLELESRATSRATIGGAKTIRDSQAYSQGSQRFSQPLTRLSQPMIERHRNDLNGLISFVETHHNKNRPSTHLATGLLDMLVDNFGGADLFRENNQENFEPSFNGGGYDMDFEPAGGMEDDGDSDDYVRNLTRRKERKAGPAFWDDLEKTRIPHYNGDEDVPTTRKPVKVLTKVAPPIQETLRRKRLRDEKAHPKTRRDEFMETHDYLRDHYYWRSAARINPNKDWKVEALRTSILAEKKRRVKEKTAKIREIRAQNTRAQQPTRQRGIPVEEYEAAMEDVVPPINRRTMGMEYDGVVDEDLAAEVELSMLGGGYDDDFDGLDVQPMAEMIPDYDAPMMDAPEPVSTFKPLRFEDIDDAELNNVINLPGNLFIDKALPLLKNFAENKSDREQMAYKMAKAYEDVDVAVSTLQEQVDKWHAKLEPILDEGETRKEYDVHAVGRAVIAKYAAEGETKRLVDLVVAHPWYEISRYFLSCLFMCNTGNVAISEDEGLGLEEKINTMKITLLKREMHCEKFKDMAALGGGGSEEKKD